LLLPSKAFAAEPKQARIIVSLADNANQGIVPIKASLGNGQNPGNNLYWGALYGAKTHFKRMKGWTVKSANSDNASVLDSFMLSNVASPSSKILVEAWDGAQQKQAVKSYFQDLRNDGSLNDLVCFVGHNALMDLFLANVPALKSTRDANIVRGRKGVVIACQSSPYFEPHHDALGVESYVMTWGLMAPEAYVLEGILTPWLKGEGSNAARAGAAMQYARYRKISVCSANRLFGVRA